MKWRSNVLRRIGDESLVRSMVGGMSDRGPWVRFMLVSTAFVLSVLGLANLQTPRAAATVQRSGVDVMFVLDVSRSMYADDMTPNRLQVSRQMLSRVMERHPDARIGLVLFAGRAYLQMPLTYDHAGASAFISAAGPESVPSQGTAVAEALTIGAMALAADEKTQKVLFMVTDGEDHEEGVDEAAALIRESGIRLMVAGVGTESGVALKDPSSGLVRLDAEGRPVVTRLNEPLLRSIAEKAGGVYLGSSRTEQVVGGFSAQVEAMEKKPTAIPAEGGYASHFQWFLGGAFLLLLLEQLYREKKTKV